MWCNWRVLFVLILSTNMSCKTDNASNKNISIEKEDSRLNIVIIMVDDLDYSDLVCFGGEIDTPNLNGLTKIGFDFQHFIILHVVARQELRC